MSEDIIWTGNIGVSTIIDNDEIIVNVYSKDLPFPSLVQRVHPTTGIPWSTIEEAQAWVQDFLYGTK